MPRQLILRHATNRDFKLVSAFYEANSHPNLKSRGDDLLLQAVREDRNLFIVTDEGNIVGAAAIFGHLDGNYRESGAARVVASGYGLQKVLLWARTLHTFLNDPPRREFFAVVSKADNSDAKRSLAALETAGYVAWSNVPPELLAIKGDDKFYLRFPREALALHARQLLNVNGSIRQHRSQEEEQNVILDIQIEAFYYVETLKQIAEGDLSSLGEEL